MLSMPPSVRIYVASAPTDMRKGFDSLAALVTQVIREDIFAGHLFVFRNRRGTHVKILWWDRSGYAVFYKRLERGVFRFPETSTGTVTMTAAELSLVLEGIDLDGAHRHPRYKRHRDEV